MAQTPGAGSVLKVRNSLVKLKCDVHPWMTAYLWVLDNALFSVTGSDGAFRIEKLPPGVWTVEVWHERFGTRTAQVTVVPWGRTRVDFHY